MVTISQWLGFPSSNVPIISPDALILIMLTDHSIWIHFCSFKQMRLHCLSRYFIIVPNLTTVLVSDRYTRHFTNLVSVIVTILFGFSPAVGFRCRWCLWNTSTIRGSSVFIICSSYFPSRQNVQFTMYKFCLMWHWFHHCWEFQQLSSDH